MADRFVEVNDWYNGYRFGEALLGEHFLQRSFEGACEGGKMNRCAFAVQNKPPIRLRRIQGHKERKEDTLRPWRLRGSILTTLHYGSK